MTLPIFTMSDTTENHTPQDDDMDMPPHFMAQIRAIQYTSGKPLQSVLNAVLANALPPPAQHPGAMLAISYELMQPGDSIGEMMARFQEVRDHEGLPIRDDEITLAVESMTGTIDPLTAALCSEAGDIFNGEQEPEQPAPETIRDGDEWTNS